MTKVLCLAVITSLLIITSTKRFLELPIFISYWSWDSHDLSGWPSKKQINSILSSVCSVIDHRWSQNVVRTKQVAHEAQPSMLVMFSPHFDVFCDLLLCRSIATWNLFVLYDKKAKYCWWWSYICVCPLNKNRSKRAHNLAYIVLIIILWGLSCEMVQLINGCLWKRFRLITNVGKGKTLSFHDKLIFRSSDSVLLRTTSEFHALQCDEWPRALEG